MEVIAKLNEEFSDKLKLIVGEEEEYVKNGVESSRETGGGDGGDRGEEECDDGKDESEEDADDDDEEEEFSFVFLNPDGTLITAEEAFKDGQIRTSFPLFDQDRLFGDGGHTVGVVSGHGDGDRHTATETAVSLRPPLRKVFAEDRSGVGFGETSGTSAAGRTVVEISTAPDTCKKSHSTGFSKLWRFRDLLHRSNSDGRDAFVFLKNQHAVDANPSLENAEKTLKEKKGKHKTAPSSSAEKHFKRSKATREAGKKKSYLPYKQVGLFTNVNELSRNIHPL